MSEPIRILIVEDLPTDADLAMREIRKSLPDCVFQRVETEPAYLEALQKFKPDLILSDYHMPRFTGMQALKLAQEHAPLTPLIIYTGSLSEDIAADCMRAGAVNYIIKENLKRLGTAVVHALEEKKVRIERKLAEEALKKSENEYRHLFDNANDVIMIFEPEHEIVLEANAVACATYGYSHDELVGMSQKKLSRDVEKGKAHIQDFLAGQPQANFETVHINKKGEEIHFLINCSLVEYGNGKAIMSISRDITERKQAEEQLRQSERQQLLLLQSTDQGIYGIDREGLCTFINRSAVRMIGYQPGEVIGRNMHVLIHHTRPDGSPYPIEECPIFNAFRTGVSMRITDEVLWRKDGSACAVEYTSNPIMEDENIIGSVITFNDITERKQAEEALLQKVDELERFHRLTVGRELKLIELKKEINILLKQADKQEKYRIVDGT